MATTELGITPVQLHVRERVEGLTVGDDSEQHGRLEEQLHSDIPADGAFVITVDDLLPSLVEQRRRLVAHR